MDYHRRLVDDTLDKLLAGLPAISLEGAKAVGKTATASRRAATIVRLDDPRAAEAVFATDEYLATLTRPLLIDEWQLVPTVWDQVRRAVDDRPGEAGMFLLTGSSSLATDARVHSGAGRIFRATMRPLSMVERDRQTPTVSLANLMASPANIGGTTDLTLGDYVDEILQSGLPGIRALKPSVQGFALDGYLANIVEHDVEELGVRVRKPAAMMAWLRAYAQATSTSADYAKILDAATPGESDKPTRITLDTYREHLTRLFILDPLPAWMPHYAALKRLTVSPKHHLVDPALAARLAGVKREGLLVGEGDRVSDPTGSWLGALFESLVVQSVRVYADFLGWNVGHLRTHRGEREIDIVLEAPNRDVVAIEVKLSGVISDGDASHLRWLKTQLGPRLKDTLVVSTGPSAYRRPDGVAVVPLALLGP